MKRETWTVISGYLDRQNRHWVFLKGRPSPLIADEALPEGSAVMIRNGKAVRP